MLQAARYVIEILFPAILVSVLWLLQPFLAPGVTWPQSVVAFVFVSGLPCGVPMWMQRRGKVADHHIGDRRPRAPMMVVAGISLAIGAALLLVLDAPAGHFGKAGAIFLGVLGFLVANLVWKPSVHGAVAAYVALAVAATVGWPRIELKDHTSTQVLVGLLVGCAVYAIGLSLP